MAEEINLERLAEQVKITIEALKKVTPGSVRQRELQQLYDKQIQSLRTLQKNTASGTVEFQKVNRTLAETQDAFDDYRKELDKASEGEKKRESERENIHKKYREALKGLGTSFVGLADASTIGTDKLGYFTKSFEGSIFQPFNALAKSLDYNIDNYKTLASFGADFGKSLLGLRQAALQAQLPIEEFRNAVGRNTENLAALFGTVNQGTRGFSDITNIVRRDLSGSFADLGLTTEQLLEYQNTYLSRQRIQGRMDYLNNQAVSQQVTAYAKSLNELSRLTGIQNAELDKQVKEQQADGVFQAYLSSLDEKTAMNTQNLIATLSAVNPALGTTAKNLLATGVPLDDLGQELTALAPGFQDAIMAFKQSGDVAGTLQNLRDSAKGFQSRFQGTSGAATLLAGGLSDASNSVVKLASMNLDLAAAQEQQRKAADPLTRELAKFEDSARRFKASLENISTQALGSFVSGLGVGMGTLNTTMQQLGKFVQENPKSTAFAMSALIAAKYAGNFAKEVGIVYTGTSMALNSTGFIQSLKNFTGIGSGKMSQAVGRNFVGFGGAATRSIGAVGVGLGTNYLQEKAGKDTDVSKLIGVGGTAAQYALLGSIFGPWGTAIGGLLGAGIGAYQNFGGDKRAIGGGLNINSPTLVGERGPELILPKTSGQVVPLMSSANKDASVSSVASAITGSSVDLSGLQTTMSSVRDILSKSENHLNKLVSVGLTQIKTTEDVKTAVGKGQGNFAYVG